MSLKFISIEKRNELALRLARIAHDMQRSFDQGHDGRIAITEEMIGDIHTAVAAIAFAEVASEMA